MLLLFGMHFGAHMYIFFIVYFLTTRELPLLVVVVVDDENIARDCHRATECAMTGRGLKIPFQYLLSN